MSRGGATWTDPACRRRRPTMAARTWGGSGLRPGCANRCSHGFRAWTNPRWRSGSVRPSDRPARHCGCWRRARPEQARKPDRSGAAQVVAGPWFTSAELPTPTPEERRAPGSVGVAGGLLAIMDPDGDDGFVAAQDDDGQPGCSFLFAPIANPVDARPAEEGSKRKGPQTGANGPSGMAGRRRRPERAACAAARDRAGMPKRHAAFAPVCGPLRSLRLKPSLLPAQSTRRRLLHSARGRRTPQPATDFATSAFLLPPKHGLCRFIPPADGLPRAPAILHRRARFRAAAGTAGRHAPACVVGKARPHPRCAGRANGAAAAGGIDPAASPLPPSPDPRRSPARSAARPA